MGATSLVKVTLAAVGPLALTPSANREHAPSARAPNWIKRFLIGPPAGCSNLMNDK
jgi:hypothetical protein